VEKNHGQEVEVLLDCIYKELESKEVWISAVSSYLSSYPYTVLEAFCEWSMTEAQVKKVKSFIQEERTKELPQLICRVAESGKSEQVREDFVVWLGTVYPFEILERMHCFIFGEK
jgi:hypothetical protein